MSFTEYAFIIQKVVFGQSYHSENKLKGLNFNKNEGNYTSSWICICINCLIW